MKKILFLYFIVMVVFWSCGLASAKQAGQGKDDHAEKSRRKAIQDKTDQIRSKGFKADANRPSGKGERKHFRDESQRQTQRGKREKLRQMRRQAEGESQARGKVEKSEELKKHQQQLSAFKTQALEEEAKHRKRLARLERIRQLAVEENSTEIIERVDKLLEKQQQRYERKRQRIRMRIEKSEQKASQPDEESSAGKPKRTAGKRDKKEKAKAGETNKVEDINEAKSKEAAN